MKHIITILIAVIASVAAVKFTTPAGDTQTASKRETAYERVMRTKTLRCGWFVEPPFTYKDEKTGRFSGISVDLINEIARGLNLKVKWAEQISFATFPQDLNNSRYDMVCGSIFVMPRGGQMDYTKPYALAPMYGYVKLENINFDRAFDQIDWSQTTIAGLDGEGATGAVQKLLPEAKLNILPQFSSIAEMLLNVVQNKADIGFVMPSVFADFNKNNPNTLRQAKLGKPLYTYAVTFGLSRNEPEFKALINNALMQLIISGELENILNKHDKQKYFKRVK